MCCFTRFLIGHFRFHELCEHIPEHQHLLRLLRHSGSQFRSLNNHQYIH